MADLKEIITNLKRYNSYLIFSHNRPDGDTIGSAVGLRLILESLGKKVRLVCGNEVSKKYSYIKYWNEFSNGEIENETFDCHIAVDCSSETVFSSVYGYFTSSPNTIVIDHHITNPKYAKVNYVETRAACCEIIYNIAKEIGFELTPEFSLAVMTGLITDTNSFAHNNTTCETLAIASDLFAHGGDIHTITQSIMNNQSMERSRLYLRIMNSMRFYLDNRMAVLVIHQRDLQDTGANEYDTEGFIDYPMSIGGVEVAISLLEVKHNVYKISLRSRGIVSVREIAEIYGGGGHILASGAMLRGSSEEIIDKLRFNVKQRL